LAQVANLRQPIMSKARMVNVGAGFARPVIIFLTTDRAEPSPYKSETIEKRLQKKYQKLVTFVTF